MNIILNGKHRVVPEKTTLQNFVEQTVKNPDLVVAEVNGAIVDRVRWETTCFEEGMIIELVTFVGGG